METRKQKKQQKNAALTFVCIGAMTSAVHGQHFQAALIKDCHGTSLVCKRENK